MTSSTKAEVSNILQHLQIRTEPPLQTTYTETLVKFRRGDRQTDRHAHHKYSTALSRQSN